jgi:MerR family transcriptional regulator/heat shock protein HspR
MDKDRPLYIISVAAELVEMHPQTLRLYERKGLIKPRRSGGKTRLYSERDIERLREIRRLTQELGVNLAGVEEILRLRSELEALQARFEAEVQRLKAELGERFKELERKARLSPEEAHRLAPQVVAAARRASLRLGFTGSV